MGAQLRCGRNVCCGGLICASQAPRRRSAAGSPARTCTWCTATPTRIAHRRSRGDNCVVPVGAWVLAYYDRYAEERLACPAADRCD